VERVAYLSSWFEDRVKSCPRFLKAFGILAIRKFCTQYLHFKSGIFWGSFVKVIFYLKKLNIWDYFKLYNKLAFIAFYINEHITKTYYSSSECNGLEIVHQQKWTRFLSTAVPPETVPQVLPCWANNDIYLYCWSYWDWRAEFCGELYPCRMWKSKFHVVETHWMHYNSLQLIIVVYLNSHYWFDRKQR
jgi:hypothetical protein